MPPLLDVRGLSVCYGRAVALDDVWLAVPRGSVVALLGPNGAGKTSLLGAVAGIVKPSAGEILLDGRPIQGLPAHQIALRGVCLVPEGRGIFPALTVAENLGIALNGDRGAAQRVFQRFPVLAERRDQVAATLSGGEQQMLSLARAVGSDPLLLMADEPSLGLAPRLVRAVMDTFRQLHAQRGLTVLLVEQYAAHALELADLVYILARGRVVWAGEPGELRASKVLAESYLGR